MNRPDPQVIGAFVAMLALRECWTTHDLAEAASNHCNRHVVIADARRFMLDQSATHWLDEDGVWRWRARTAITQTVTAPQVGTARPGTKDFEMARRTEQVRALLNRPGPPLTRAEIAHEVGVKVNTLIYTAQQAGIQLPRCKRGKRRRPASPTRHDLTQSQHQPTTQEANHG